MSADSSNRSVLRSVFTLLTGAGGAQLVPLLALPALARLYSPAEFSVFGVFTAVTAILTVLSTGRFEHAVFLAKTEGDRTQVLGVVTLCVLSFSGLVGCVAELVWLTLRNPDWQWLHFVAPTVCFTGLSQGFMCWLNALSRYRELAISRMLRAVVCVLLMLGLGFMGGSAFGLLWGTMLSQVASVAYVIWVWRKRVAGEFDRMHWQGMQRMASRFQHFARYSLLGDLLNSLSAQAPVFLLSLYYPSAVTGCFAFANRVFVAPSGLISAAIADVFRQRASDEVKAVGSCVESWKSTLRMLLPMSIGIHVTAFLVSPWAFALVFGERWKDAGFIAQALSLYVGAGFIASVLGRVLYVMERTREDLIWQVGLFVIVNASLGLGVLSGSWYFTVWSYSLGYTAAYGVYFWMSKHFSVKPSEYEHCGHETHVRQQRVAA